MRKQIIGMTTGLALAGGAAGAVQAGTIPYPTPGVQNPVTYAFTAQNTGPITAYFAGSTAAFTEEVTLLVNGVPTGIQGLNDHTSVVGVTPPLVLAPLVNAGDTLIFEVVILNPSNVGPWFSDATLNSDGGNGNHIYSTSAAAGQINPAIPAGTYVAFEDLPFPSSDFNYFDDTFVFTNVAVTSGVPEPATWAMMLLGFVGLGFAFRQSRRKVSFA
jgi:PEP-CTERM motif